MRNTRPFLTTFFSLNLLGVSAITCNENPLGPTDPSKDDLAKLLQNTGTTTGPIDSFCKDDFGDLVSGVVPYNVGPLALQVSLSGKGTVHSVEADCKASIEAIVSQCVVGSGLWGGEIESGGLLFEVLRDDDNDGVLKARGVKKTTSLKKTTANSPPPPKTTPPVKTGSEKTRSTAKPASNRPVSSKSSASSACVAGSVSRAESASACAATGSTSCETAFAEAAKKVKADLTPVGKSRKNNVQAAKKLPARNEYTGSRSGLSGMAAMAHHTIERRADKAKEGKACGIDWNANHYPDSTTIKDYYGWEMPKDCTNYEWGGPLTDVKSTKALYEVEHVLEWQVVTKFFDWIYEIKKRTETFPGPDTTSERVNFCAYFINSWDRDPYTSEIDKENNNLVISNEAQPITIDGETKTPRQFLADEFPGTTFREEFVMLEANINAPAKAEAFSDKKTTTNVFSLKRISGLIADTGTASASNNAQQAVVLLKGLIGVRRYMRTPKISEHFNNQQDRIGKMLDKLDNALATATPKQDVLTSEETVNEKNNKKRIVKKVVNMNNAAWERQGLKALWVEWMDFRFETANSRLNNELNNGIELLQAPGNKFSANVKESIAALAAEWAREKNQIWKKPWET